ncbi:GGDEF domain-containing protein [Trabulsiella odontotermitis]|uniref:sensor domain-containing diguanylate cyclase n=1 Tax=Trabulsiella odontotermitis TaxID=379893 RepID=UPI0006BA6416|nr:GGDEF domain-containing protein [Trabulsiella odontotermitis]
MLNTTRHCLRHVFLFITICIAAVFIFFYLSMLTLRHTPGISTVVFPTMTIFLLVFHTMVAGFMLMKYICEKQRLYLMPIACAFAGSALLMLGTLSSYPQWYLCTAGRSINYNDAIIFYFFRNIMMATLFVAAAILFRFRKHNMHARHIHACILFATIIFTASMILLSWFYSSKSSLVSVNFIDNLTYTFTPLWRDIIGWCLVAMWCVTLVILVHISRLRNIFWYSGGFFCVCFIVTLTVLLSSDHSAGYTWYQARFIETVTTLFLIFVLLCDVFNLYRESHDKYLDSYQNSIREPLTRLYNRSYFYDTLTQQLPGTTPARQLSVIVSDLDRFKRINDQYGHLQGDKVIQFVSGVLQNAVREEDVAARIGGEEFALLLTNTSADEALNVAERIRQTICQQDPQNSGGQLPEPVTISMGVFTATEYDLSAEECVQRADQAMYAAKEAGRNRVVVWQ